MAKILVGGNMFKIHVGELEVSKVAKTYSYFGIIFIQVDEFCFPNDKWDDFIVAILRMWSENLVSSDKEYELFFMDGPYLIYCIENDNQIEMQCMRDGPPDEIRKEFSIEKKVFIRTLCETNKKVLSLIDENNFPHTRDYDQLKALNKELLRRLK
jgi:hypothetical protein